MSEFHNDDVGYRQWIENHPDGYIINLDTAGRKKSMIHRTRCRHLYPLNPHQIHTAQYRKFCSDDRAVLESWARNNDHLLAVCSNCDV